MQLNLEKTKLMIFNSSHTKDFDPVLNVNNTDIKVVEETKLLGVHPTSNLKWQKHITEITKKPILKF